jgi:hypothetical protein
MSYTQQQLDNFWWGTGGSPTSIQPGAYVTMRAQDVIYLKTTDPAWNALLTYCYQNNLYGFGNPRTTWDGTGGNCPGGGWIGPTLIRPHTQLIPDGFSEYYTPHVRVADLNRDLEAEIHKLRDAQTLHISLDLPYVMSTALPVARESRFYLT